MGKLRHRYIFDIVISVLLIIEMFYEITGDVLHELFGAAFFVTIIVHLVLSKKWMMVTARKVSAGTKLRFTNKLRLVLAVGLGLSFLALVASSIAISLVLIDTTGINLAGSARETWIIIHTASSYALCVFTVAHVLVHWTGIFAAFRVPYNPARRQAINTGASAVVAVLAIALGVAGSQAIDDIVNPKLPQRDTGTPDAEAANANPAPAPTPQSPDAGSTPPQRGEKKFRRGPEGEAESNHPQPPYENGSGSNQTQPPAGYGSSGDAGSSQQGGSSSSGYCTLCKLRCPLSDPECNRPYQAGLL